MMKNLYSREERVFATGAVILLAILTGVAVLPFLLITIASITSEKSLISNGYSFAPDALSLDAYQYMLAQSKIVLRAYSVSIRVTVTGTIASLLLVSTLAYPLSRPEFPFRRAITFFVVFTLLFNGGVVPSYIMWTRVFHLKNTIWALIVPNYLMSGFSVLLVKNYFEKAIPKDLIEAAQIDGASELTIFFRIMLPLSVPVLATVGMLTALAYWNDWINGLYYINDPRLYGIQQLLIRILDNIQFLKSGTAAGALGSVPVDLPSTAVRMALAVIGILPILLVFPLLQKYFIKGMVVGAIKG
ncbi:MAG TPA: carbohydrate ABC transporter permease [Aggregatilineaceae bacterium]|nr:carbohydrate ABC transporter permease [Aggregatilineaceae bacterium]